MSEKLLLELSVRIVAVPIVVLSILAVFSVAMVWASKGRRH